MRFFKQAKDQRLFILGLDGSPLPLLRQLMESGDLPNLARAFARGTSVEMDSSLPDVSAVAWTSVITGKNPAKHGIYGFVDRKPGTTDLEVMTASHVKAKTLWELVSDAGKRAIAINVPLSYPPQRINGVVVSDFLAPSLNKAVYPVTLLPKLQNMDYRIDTDPWIARQSLDDFAEDFRITANKRAQLVIDLMSNQQWDLFMVVFMETDRLHHFMWEHMEKQHPKFGPMFLEAYRQIDRLAGEILGKLSDDDSLIIMSDHGFTTLEKEVYLNVWLQQEGYLSFDDGAEPGLGTMSAATRAYSLDPGRIYVHLQGRELRGSVPSTEKDSLVDELASKLLNMSDPDSSKPIVKAVYRAKDIYAGPWFDRAPDLVVMPHDGFDIKGTFDARQLTGRGPLVGMHKYDNATLFVRDHRITVGHASVHDVLPTACKLLNITCPVDADGRVIIAS